MLIHANFFLGYALLLKGSLIGGLSLPPAPTASTFFGLSTDALFLHFTREPPIIPEMISTLHYDDCRAEDGR